MSLVSRISAAFAQVAADIKACAKRVVVPEYLTANRTLTAADSGGTFIYNGGTGTSITITFPATLPDGFKCRIKNAGLGTVAFDATGYGAHFGNASRIGLIFQWDVADIEIYTALATKIIDTVYNLALPVLYVENAASFTRNVTAMSAVPGMTLNLEKNAAYDVQILVQFTSANVMNSLKVGLLALPTGATCSLEAVIWTSATAGGTPNWSGIFTTSAQAVAGLAGNASATGVTMLASIRGRVRTGATAGSLAVAAGALSALGVQTVAAGAASMSVSKVYDQDRT